jgi:hypothetical protein
MFTVAESRAAETRRSLTPTSREAAARCIKTLVILLTFRQLMRLDFELISARDKRTSRRASPAYFFNGLLGVMRVNWTAVAVAATAVLGVLPAFATSPAQRLPSAILMYPNIRASGSFDTRVEMVNLSSRDQTVKCYYLASPTCNGTNFFIRLTPNQPISWLASRGTLGGGNLQIAVPPFFGEGSMKCIVIPEEDSMDDQNAIQGRAIAFGPDGYTESFGAIGIQRLTPGPFSNTLELDGDTYAQCPDEYHFTIVASELNDAATESEIVLSTCDEDLQNLISQTVIVQFQVINEFEQLLSASTSVRCYERKVLRQINSVFSRDTLGTPTGQLIARGVGGAVIAVVVDKFRTPGGTPAVAANEPALSRGRSARISIP